MATDPLVRRAWRELTEPERCAWARMWARWCGSALRRGQRFTVVVAKRRSG